MDPNRILADLRDWATGDHPMDDVHREAAENFLALDRWLTRGGFPPTPWRQPRPGQEDILALRADLAEAQAKLAEIIQDLSAFPQNAHSRPQEPAQGLQPNDLTPNYPLDPLNPSKAPR